MRHFDEKTIELILLGDRSVAGQREELERHCEECASCADLRQEIGEFYGAVLPEREKLAAAEQESYTPVFTPQYHQPPAVRPGGGWRTLPQRVTTFVRQRPFTSGTVGLVFAGFLYIGVTFVQGLTDRNPASLVYNPSIQKYEVLNRSVKKIGEVPIVVAIADYEAALRQQRKYIVVADLEGDGKNEIVSVFLGHPQCNLRIFNSDLTLRKQIPLNGIPVSYQGSIYQSQFHSKFLIVEELTGDGRTDIVIGLNHNHSPFIVQRFDFKGDLVGTYVHYGHLGYLSANDVNDDGIKEILAVGMDDEKSQGKLVALDIRKVTDSKQSATTPGFEYPVSDAEVTSMLFPNSDMRQPANLDFAIVRYVMFLKDRTCTLYYREATFSQESSISFYYELSSNLEFLDVKPGDDTHKVRQRLIKEGKLPPVPIDQTYRQKLGSRILYWRDGKWISAAEWKKLNT